MKKIIAALSALSFSFLLHAACSSYAGATSGSITSKISINEYNYAGGYIELKIIDSTILTATNNLNGWKLSLFQKSGQSYNRTDYTISSYLNSCTTNTKYLKIPTGSLGNDSVVVLWSDSAMTEEVDYLRVGQNSYPTFEPTTCFDNSEVPSTSTITWHQAALTGSSARKDIARGPDGTGKWIEAPYNGNDQGTACASNDGTLSLTKSVTSAATSLYVGEQVTFRITTTVDTRALTQSSVAVTDLLPSGFSYLSHTTLTGTYNTSTGIWSIGTLAASASATLDITAKVTQVGTLTNSASVESADFPTGTITPATASITGLQPLTLNKTVTPATVAYNSPASFIISVQNQSSAALPAGFTINDIVPAGLDSGTPTATAGTYIGGVWTLPSGMPSGTIYTLTLPVTTKTTAGTFTNTATANAPFNGANLSASATLTCNTTQPATFNCVEVGANGSTGHLYTKLSGTPFNFDVIALKSDGSIETSYASSGDKNVTVELVDGSGTTTCANRNAITPATSQSLIFTAANTGRKTATMTINASYTDLRCRVTDATQSPSITGCSSDNFSIRPTAYTLTSPAAVKAADFNLTVAAANGGNKYNGNANFNTSLQTANSNCPTTSGFVTSATGNPLIFVNDTNISQMKATDVGAIYFNLKDSNWTTIDQTNDCIVNSSSNNPDGNGKFGCNIEGNLSLTIKPDHFDVNASLANFNGGGFTYLSTDLAMSAYTDVNITAKTSDGNITKNYTSGCFAKTTSLSLPHSNVPSPLSKILYRDSLNGVDTNISSTSPITLSFAENKFTQGSAVLRVSINFDRNSSKPLNPFDFNLTSADVNDTDNVTGNTVPTGKATFVFGRTRAYDIKTDQLYAPNPIEFEIYSSSPTGFVLGMPQNVLNWYRNTSHTLISQGAVLSGDDYTSTTKTTPTALTIDTTASPAAGQQAITISNTSSPAVFNAVIHMDINPWLWYSPTQTYSFANGSTCAQHPCFIYTFFNSATNSTGVSTGTFRGSDFTLTPSKTTIKKGTKVFR